MQCKKINKILKKKERKKEKITKYFPPRNWQNSLKILE